MIARLAFLLVAAVLASAAMAAETRPMTLAGEETLVDLYWPAASPPRGLAVIAHGFTRTRARHAGLARRLADEGFAVAVPDLPHWFRPHGNADAIVDLVRAVETERGLGGRPAVLIGTSAGGRASLLAAGRVPRLALWVGLDPADTLGRTDEAARALHAPAVVLRAPSGHCNAGGSAKRIAALLPNLRAQLRVEGASHCDFEDTTNGRCEAFCGAADPARQALIVDATVKVVTDALPAPVVAHSGRTPAGGARPRHRRSQSSAGPTQPHGQQRVAPVGGQRRNDGRGPARRGRGCGRLGRLVRASGSEEQD